MGKKTCNPSQECQTRTNEDQVHCWLGVVTQVLAVTESAFGQEVLNLLSSILRSVAENRINGKPFETEVALRARTVITRRLTSTVVVKTPLVGLTNTVALADGRVGVVSVEICDVGSSGGKSVTETSGVNGNVTDVAGYTVVGELTNVGKDGEDDGCESEEFAYVDAKDAE